LFPVLGREAEAVKPLRKVAIKEVRELHRVNCFLTRAFFIVAALLFAGPLDRTFECFEHGTSAARRREA
jgi:hypothetical protein